MLILNSRQIEQVSAFWKLQFIIKHEGAMSVVVNHKESIENNYYLQLLDSLVEHK